MLKSRDDYINEELQSYVDAHGGGSYHADDMKDIIIEASVDYLVEKYNGEHRDTISDDEIGDIWRLHEDVLNKTCSTDETMDYFVDFADVNPITMKDFYEDYTPSDNTSEDFIAWVKENYHPDIDERVKTDNDKINAVGLYLAFLKDNNIMGLDYDIDNPVQYEFEVWVGGLVYPFDDEMLEAYDRRIGYEAELERDKAVTDLEEAVANIETDSPDTGIDFEA